MKKQILTTVILLLAAIGTEAQDTTKVSVKLYGFVRNYFNYDSRQTYTVIGGEYNMMPYDEDIRDGVDLNAVPHSQMQALTSRFGVNITGPDWGRWKSSGKLEGDFGGFGTNNTVLRLRLAYLKLKTNNEKLRTELIVGQDWHPLSGDIMPEVIGMAAGAPFRPHSRTPQVRSTMYCGPFGYTAALLWQLQFMNNGPKDARDPTSTASLNYANNALWPEAFIGLNYNGERIYAQAGINAQLLRPRTHAVVGGTYKEVDESVSSLTPTAYFRFHNPKIDIQFRTLLAQNTSHLNQLVGYGVTDVAADGTWSYAPMRASISYLNIALGKKIRGNLFLGYMKNLGTGKELYDFGTGDYLIYMKGGDEFTHLNSIYRVAPSISYNTTHFNIGLEYEWTAATYGDLQSDGTVANNANLHQVANHRLCAMVKYNF